MAARTLAVRSGDLDASIRIPPLDVPVLKEDPNLVVQEISWDTEVQYGMFNMQGDLFKDNRPLRQALLYAIDREAIASVIGPGAAFPAKYHIGPAVLGYSDSVPYYDYDLDKAKQLMAEAGYPDGGFSMMLTGRTRGQDFKVGPMLQQMWGDLGIEVEYEQFDGLTWTHKILAGEYEAAISGKSIGIIDPLALAERFHRAGAKNFSLSESPEIEACLEEGAQEFDREARQGIYERCQTLIFDDAAQWLVVEFPKVTVYRKDLEDVNFHYSTGYIKWKDVYWT